jgi:hypothetical protein
MNTYLLNICQCKSREKAQGSYRVADLGRSIFVVVMFDLWEVRCLRVMHIN